MKNQTRKVYNQYLTYVAKLNGVDSAKETFNVAPVVEQSFQDHLAQDTSFLGQINLLPVIADSGDVLGLSSGLIGSTTNTDVKARDGVDPTTLAKIWGYKCRQVNFDTAFKYQKLDAWAHKKKLKENIAAVIIESTALSLISIGFNGRKWTPTSDITTNVLLEDVQRGWLQRMREENDPRVFGSSTVGGVTTAEPIKVGATGQHKNLDALVMDAKKQIDPRFRNRKDLVVIVGDDLVDDKYFSIVNASGDDATKLNASDILASEKRLGGLPPVQVPFFPDNALFITPLENLSIYMQEESHRRLPKDEPERDRIVNYESINLDYVIESYLAAVLVENIEKV